MQDHYNIPTFESEHPEAAAVLVKHFQNITVRHRINQDIVPQERNEKCECGSGRKFKKCCANIPVRRDSSWSMRIISRDGKPVDGPTLTSAHLAHLPRRSAKPKTQFPAPTTTPGTTLVFQNYSSPRLRLRSSLAALSLAVALGTPTHR